MMYEGASTATVSELVDTAKSVTVLAGGFVTPARVTVTVSPASIVLNRGIMGLTRRSGSHLWLRTARAVMCRLRGQPETVAKSSWSWLSRSGIDPPPELAVVDALNVTL